MEYTPDHSACPEDKKSRRRLVKIEERDQNSSIEGKWTKEENVKYVLFMDYHTTIFSSKEKRKYLSSKVGLSEFSSRLLPSWEPERLANVGATFKRSWTSSRSSVKSSSTTSSLSGLHSIKISLSSWLRSWRLQWLKFKMKSDTFQRVSRQIP